LTVLRERLKNTHQAYSFTCKLTRGLL